MDIVGRLAKYIKYRGARFLVQYHWVLFNTPVAPL